MPADHHPIRLHLLGGFRLLVDGNPKDLPARKAVALLGYVAVNGSPIRRDALARLLWPDSEPAAARQSLRQALSDLRTALRPHADVLLTRQDTLGLDAERVWLDAAQLEHVCRSASEHLHQVADLYAGELLEGFTLAIDDYDEWLTGAREHYRAMALDALRRLAEAEEAPEKAAAYLRRLLALDPLDEASHRDLMRLHIAAGHDGAAIKQFIACRAILQRELNLQPDPETVALYEALLAHRERQPRPADTSREPSQPPQETQRLRFAALLSAHLKSQLDDPEAADDAWQQAAALLGRIAHRYGGRRLSHGATPLVVFGLDESHGTEADRARYAAEHLRAEDSRYGIGIAAGQVLYKAEADAVSGQPLADVLELAMTASASEILLSDQARAMLRAPASVTTLQPNKNKLLDKAPSIHPAPMLGRDLEVRQFVATADTCRSSGHGCTLMLRGEAGIGKTRLVTEWCRIADNDGFSVHVNHVLDFGALRERGALAGLARSLAGSESPTRSALTGCGLDDGLLPFIADLLGEELEGVEAELVKNLEPAARNERRAAGLGAMIGHRCRQRPVLLVIEDVHWADPDTLSTLARTAHFVSLLPALMVLTSRIEGAPHDAQWRADMHGAPLVTLDLRPLHPEDAAALARRLGASDTQPLVERAGGNPLFLEQLIAAGRLTSLPATVHALAVARLDLLDPPARAAAQAASVLGQRFAAEDLAPLLPTGTAMQPVLGQLAADGLMHNTGNQWRFHHALIQEGIYRSLLKHQRAELHLAAAARFEGAQPELHAQHLLRGGSAEAASAFINLGHQQLKAGRARQAIESFSQALASSEDTSTRSRALLGRGMAHNQLDDSQQAIADLNDAARAGEGNDALLAEVQLQLGNALFPQGRTDECLAAHQRSLAYATRCNSALLAAQAEGGVGDAYYQRGQMRTANAHFARCVELATQDNEPSVIPANQAMHGLTLLFVNNPARGIEIAREALELATEIGNLRQQILAHDIIAVLETWHGDYAAGIQHGERCIELSKDIGARRFLCDGYTQLAYLYWFEGNKDQAHEALANAWQQVGADLLPFSGAYIRGLQALLAQQQRARHQYLAAGVALLDAGSVSHCHIFFYAAAISASLANGEISAASTFADRLQAYTADEPLPFTDWFIHWARSATSDEPGESVAEQARLATVARDAELRSLLQALSSAGHGRP